MLKREAIVKHIQGVTFAGKADTGHWVIMDGPARLGGSDAGPRPKELVLIGLGGCTASDVANILQKKRVPFEDLEVLLHADAAEEPPQVYTKIHIEFIVYGEDINPADVERAIELSTSKYCSVSAMLRASVELTHSYRIEPPRRLSVQTANGTDIV
jgi:putative redox protein